MWLSDPAEPWNLDPSSAVQTCAVRFKQFRAPKNRFCFLGGDRARVPSQVCSRKGPSTLILSPLRAGRGEVERTRLGSMRGAPNTVPKGLRLASDSGRLVFRR